MKKQTINYSWPATLSDFSKDEAQGNFSRGKLSVFFIGETEDHRKFSKEFSEKVVKTLKYTPVVSCYDEEEEDFVGHASQQQIFGIVDPCTEPTFETLEDGKVWCVCDVVFYTERPDKVGEIAKKIVGHEHSLELDPKTVKYVVNYDERKHFKNIEFTDASFIGVSVLGKKQKPAFTGSEFFSINDFEEKLRILKDYCENVGKEEINPTQNGGEKMQLEEFMKLSYGEISLKVEEAICKEYQNDAYVLLVDMYDDSVIVRMCYYVDGSNKLMRIKYSCDENGNVTLGEIHEVRVVYENVATEQQNTNEANTTEEPELHNEGFENAEAEENDAVNLQESEVVEEQQQQQQPLQVETEMTATNEEVLAVEETVNEEENVVENVSNDDLAVAEENTTVEETEVEETEVVAEKVEQSSEQEVVEQEQSFEQQEQSEIITPETLKVSVENETELQENNSSSTSFVESERAEFEALKREKKVNLLDSYKEILDEDEIAQIVETIDEVTFEDLELTLLRKYKNSSKQERPMRIFSYASSDNEQVGTGNYLEALIRKNLKQ